MKCTYCQKRDVPDKRLSRYCCIECADKDMSRRPGLFEGEYTKCLSCGALLSRIHTRKYCNQFCKKEYESRNKKSRNIFFHRNSKRISLSREVKARVFKASNGACVYCGRDAEAIDHITPLCKGGSNDLSNLVAACGKCNSIANGKSFRSITEKQQYIMAHR